jgi:hypothetical protein
MLMHMVKEADIDRIPVPEGYDVLDATALGQRLGLKRNTVLAYLLAQLRRGYGRTGSWPWGRSGSSAPWRSGRRGEKMGKRGKRWREILRTAAVADASKGINIGTAAQDSGRV